ncbi:DUF2238 domain-containing protein [Candidatus Pacearchaeota archaeon]|nr:DUF2238 domain-containing protein [Candidatus Pacearchaeota archaeon]
MKEKTKRLFPIYLSAIILAVFTIYFLLRGNLEFLVYAVTLFPLMWIIARTDNFFDYSPLAKWGFAVWMITHMTGGSLYIGGTRLYDSIIINILGAPFYILRYDQVIHAFCYFVITLFIYSIVKKMSEKPKTKSDSFLIILVAFLASMGISALNEVVELIAVAFFNSAGVGDYYNNALDLVFNGIGAIIALFFMHRKG